VDVCRIASHLLAPKETEHPVSVLGGKLDSGLLIVEFPLTVVASGQLCTPEEVLVPNVCKFGKVGVVRLHGNLPQVVKLLRSDKPPLERGALVAHVYHAANEVIIARGGTSSCGGKGEMPALKARLRVPARRVKDRPVVHVGVNKL